MLNSADINTLKTIRRVIMEFRQHCQNQTGIEWGCCNDPDTECAIAMGEWWGDFEEGSFQDFESLFQKLTVNSKERNDG